MKSSIRLFALICLIMGLILVSCGKKNEEPEAGEIYPAEEEEEISEVRNELPWIFGGYTKLDQFHLRYYYVSGEAAQKVLRGEMSWEESIRGNTQIDEVWFKREGSLLRWDRYAEKLEVKCESFEGEQLETISHNGKTYTLYERRIQKGWEETRYTIAYGEQTGYDDQSQQAIVQSCQLKKSTHTASKEPDPDSVVSKAGLYRYHQSSADDKELLISGLDLDKVMNPSKYKKIVEGWKVKQEIAGRTAVKHYGVIPVVMVGADGFEFIDTELGVGLAGYLEECRAYGEIEFEKPQLVYKALLVETTVSPDVFESNK